MVPKIVRGTTLGGDHFSYDSILNSQLPQLPKSFKRAIQKYLNVIVIDVSIHDKV